MLQLYKNIKKQRQLLNMTQSELAKKLGYADKSMIAKIEKGIVDLTQSKILAFADALETTPEELMGWEEKSDNPSRIWKNVKQARENNNISQEQLAELANMSLDLIKEIEENKKIPDYEIIVKLAEILKCDVSYLFFGDELNDCDFTIIKKIEDIMKGDDEARKKVVKASVEFNDEDIMLLERIIDALNTKKAD